MALNALEETRFWNGLARAYEYIAEMHIQLENWEEAVRCADKRIELARQHTNERMEAAAWLQKAEALAGAGRHQDAEECCQRANGIASANR
jgi:tetratricopeptide (TPR) repeat protein